MEISKKLYGHMVDNQRRFSEQDWNALGKAMCREFSRPTKKTEHNIHFIFQVFRGSEKLRSLLHST